MQRIKYLIAFIALPSVNISAGEIPCPHGTLDSIYCDRDGDMLADPPADSSQGRDPYGLVFAYSPVEDPTVYKKVWKDFIAHLSRVTGKRVVFFPFQSNVAEIEAMRIGKLHVAGMNYPTASNGVSTCYEFIIGAEPSINYY